MPNTETLQDAIKRTYRQRWATARDNGKTLLSQAERACADLAVLITQDDDADASSVWVSAVTPETVQQATSQWYAEGLSPATITKRLNCLSAMGIQVNGMRPKKARKLQWWLRPEEEAKAVAWLATSMVPDADLLRDFIRWTTRTGLRVEETLRLKWSDFSWTEKTVMVPGLKTATSQATLPLDGDAGAVVWDRRCAEIEHGEGLQAGTDAPKVAPFPLTYDELVKGWNALREAMGWPEGATLKALRRSAARYLHVDCGMPLDMVRSYLRHEDIATTMGYLRLTGGYGTEEMRRFLK